MFSFDKMLLCFILAYVIVFLLEIGHVIVKIKFLDSPTLIVSLSSTDLIS